MDTRIRHLLKIGVLANAFEWYEFSIFAFLAGQLGQVFFQAAHPMTGVLKGFMMFAMSYLMRPIGGLCFGLLGDKWGNHFVLRFSLLLMAIPTVLIGLLPTYNTLGLLAPVLLLMLRLIQGLAMAGELPSSARYVFENAPLRYRSLICSVAMSSTTVGVLMGSFVIAILVHFFDQATLLQWAWRIPFWLSIPLTLFINYIRQTVGCLPLTEQPLHQKQVKPCNRHHDNLLKPLIKATILISFSTICFYTIVIWMPTYLSYFLKVPVYIAQWTNTVTLVLSLLLYPIMGYCAQRFGYTRVLAAGISSIVLLIVPLFQSLLLLTSYYHVLMLQLIFIALFVMINSVTIEMLMQLFPSIHRGLGIGLAWSVPTSIIGSTTPLLYSYVIDKTGWLLFPAYYIVLFGIAALPIALKLKPVSRHH